MGDAAHHFPVQARREDRLETRLFLRQLLGEKGGLDGISNANLHEREVATFILRCAKFLWAASDAAQIDSLSVLLEGVFCEAFVKAGGKPDEALALFKDKKAKVEDFA